MTKSFQRILKWALFAGLLLPVLVTFCSRFDSYLGMTPDFYAKMAIAGALAVVLGAVGVWALEKFSGLSDQWGEAQAHFIDTMPERWVNLAIILSAATSLYLELVVIRWQSSVWPLFSFYKNFSLLACFAGLGLGYALAGRRVIPLFFSMPLMAAQMLLMIFMKDGMEPQRIVALRYLPVTEQLAMGMDAAVHPSHFVAIDAFLLVFFLLTALAFLPIGQLCGRLLQRRPSLTAYGFNLLGSLIGVLAIFMISYLWTPPVVWFALGFAGLVVFQIHNPRVLLLGTLAALISLMVLAWPVHFLSERVYSPYQMLERNRGNYGLTMISAGGHYYQRIHNLADWNKNKEAYDILRQVADYYEMPYRVHGGEGLKVAIVGAGTGNDVAAALRRGASYVEAIEIDPAIQQIGEHYHPENPYGSDKVHVTINDARTFLRNTDEEYDLVVYGLLDSHSMLSHASSVRLDSFVYTVEGLKEARERLKDDGVISLSFSMMGDQIGRKIYLLMTEAFDGKPPICIEAGYDGSVIYFQQRDGNLKIPPELLAQVGFKDITEKYADSTIKADISTDDWPFFYMPERVYPKSYITILVLILLTVGALTLNFFKLHMRFGHPVYFLMGAGFMLVETKSITELGLYFGNTWQVIGLVIAGILLMAFLANVAVQKFNIKRPTVPFLLLIISLGVGLAVSKWGGLGASYTDKLIALVVLTIPMFFSGIVFSTLINAKENLPSIMAVNLLGAMVGGILEYNSMYFGFQFLYILAIGLYLLAWLSSYVGFRVGR